MFAQDGCDLPRLQGVQYVEGQLHSDSATAPSMAWRDEWPKGPTTWMASVASVAYVAALSSPPGQPKQLTGRVGQDPLTWTSF